MATVTTATSNWWEHAYPGGPMVPVPGFPRPLYPPDATGKNPSIRGPDVEAYKRTIVRAGRWPGPLSDLDRQYSNNFAHGFGGNVSQTGVAGVQRQQGIDDTGWVGKQTFNTLRSIRIPEGLSHAGEMAMDANAANLVALAWELFGGSEPTLPTPTPLTVRDRALKGAIGWIGTKESPAGSNHTPFGTWYGVDGQPWCAIFQTYCFEVEAGGSPTFVKGSAYAYVPYIVSDARNQRNGLLAVSSPIPGDLVCYDWGYDGTYDHVGIFEAWEPGSSSTFTAIEGNTSSSNNSNGGEVMRRTRSLNDAAIVFARVAEPTK